MSIEMERGSVSGCEVTVYRAGQPERYEDLLAVEEPLEIRLAGVSVAVTMRTPGHDLDLAAGFLFTEGIVRGAHDIASIAYCPAERDEAAFNIVNVNPVDPALVEPARWQRNFIAGSSCGICGKASIEAIRQYAAPIRSQARIDASLLPALAVELSRTQRIFQQTGGLHAAALFDVAGQLLIAREDVGRHNAVDKVIGAALRQGTDTHDRILVVSSRASFEIVQKALLAGIPIVATVSAASSLAVELARESGMTLAGFVRHDPVSGDRLTLYAGEERISSSTNSRHVCRETA